MKSKGVTTQMKALDEYFLTVVFTLLLNRLHVVFLAIFMFNLNRTKGSKRVKNSDQPVIVQDIAFYCQCPGSNHWDTCLTLVKIVVFFWFSS